MRPVVPRVSPRLKTREAIAGSQRPLLLMMLGVLTAILMACEPDPAACCRADGECAEGAVCHEGHCTPKCQDDAQCYGGQTCLSGACVFVGRPVSQCGFDFIEEPDFGTPEVGEPDVQPDVQPVVLEPEGVPEPFEPEGVPEPFEPDVTPEPSEPEPFEPEPFEPDPGEPDPEPGPDPGCDDDPFEPNNNRNQAAFVDIDVDYSLSICGENDRDFFAIDLEPGTTLVARIDFIDADGDLDMALFQEGVQSPVETSNSTQDFEEIVYTANQGGRFFIRVIGFAGQEGPYRLRVSLSSGPICEDDNFEPNDTLLLATPIESSFPVQGRFCEGGEVDVFAVFDIDPNSEVFIDFFEFLNAGLFNINVFDSSGAPILSEQTAQGQAFIAFPAGIASPGPLFVEVQYVPNTGIGMREYELVVSVEPGFQICGDDGFEPNDTLQTSSVVPQNQPIEAAICELDVDHYEFVVEGSSARLIINSDPGRQLLAVVRDAELNPIRDYFGTFIIDSFPIDGPFFVEVSTLEGGEGTTSYFIIAEPD